MHETSNTARATARQTLGLCILLGTMYFVQGVGEPTEGLLSQPVKSILKSWSTRPGDIVLFTSLMVVPWCVKPIYGLLSDFVPLAGSRRKSYLALTSAVAAVSYLALYVFPAPSGDWWRLLLAILIPTTAVAWSSVVVDALMVEWGQPLGITGRLQGVQWAAIWAATIIDGAWGGYLSQTHLEDWGFLICGVLSAGVAVLALVVVREPARLDNEGSLQLATRTLAAAARTRSVALVALFLFVWSFNPFSNAILYLHMTDDLKLGEQLFGDSISVLALGCLVASVSYSFYCRRVRFGLLLKLSIVCGSVSTLAYWALVDRPSAFVVSFAVGFFHMTGLIVMLDLAARTCPIKAAGTLFALFMALTNISATLACWLGGLLYDQALDRFGPLPSYQLLVIVGSALPALAWLLVPALSHELAAIQHWERPAEPAA
ncbi:MAG: MFS transporter [Pirellulales bacterium]|nr:MFS transporter [Pirellulales bacterium]